MPREYNRHTDTDKNILKRDIAIRIAEAANAFGEVVSGLKFNTGDFASVFKVFYSNFVKLYDQTVDQLNEEDREDLQEDIEKWFESQMPVQEKDGQRVVDLVSYAQEGVSLYRDYKEAMRECGILNLDIYTPKQRTYGGKPDKK